MFIVSGLSLAGGLVVFASVLSDVYLENPRRYNAITSIINKNKSQLTFDYRYGWSFFAAGAAFIMAEVAALISITAYVRRFPTVEDLSLIHI